MQFNYEVTFPVRVAADLEQKLHEGLMSPRLWVKNNDTHLGLYHINPLSVPVPGAGARGFHPPAQGQVGQGCRCARGQAHSPTELQAGLWESTGMVTGSSPWHACHLPVIQPSPEEQPRAQMET